jgi:hypothetical protein
MKVSVKDNLKEVNKWTTNVQKKQIPFATAMAINKTLGIGKGNRMKGLDREMQKQMIQKLDRPMARTTKAFYRIGARKTNLTGTLGFTEWANKFMQYLVHGGVRSGESSKVGVPYVPNAKLNKFGNIAGRKSGLIKKQSQFIGNIKSIDGVWERQKDRSVKLMVAFKNSVTYQAMFPFYKIAEKYSKARFDKNFAEEFTKALRNAK